MTERYKAEWLRKGDEFDHCTAEVVEAAVRMARAEESGNKVGYRLATRQFFEAFRDLQYLRTQNRNAAEGRPAEPMVWTYNRAKDLMERQP